MKIKTIDDFDLTGKRVLLRVDLNSEISNGKVLMNDRIREHSKTILKLKKKKAKVVVVAHQGRPGDRDFTSLREHSKQVNKFVKIKFIPDILGDVAIDSLLKMKEGEAILLDNVRFLKDEFKPSVNNDFVKSLAGMFDVYINDAFSIMHRNNTSIVSFPKILDSGIGDVAKKEMESAEKIKKLKNALYILGGAKVGDVIPLMKNRRVLTGGILAELCLIAKGYNLGKQRFLKGKTKFIPVVKRYLKNAKYPSDLAVDFNGKRVEIGLDELPSNHDILDIGGKTIDEYIKEIRKSKVILIKGPLGYSENKKFCKGTKKILKELEKSDAFTIVSGGHTISALDKLKINKKKINHISLSGGALVHYLNGEKLPGLEVLKKR